MNVFRTIVILIFLTLFVFTGLKGCSYMNLKVSDKYETQLEGITKSAVLFKESNKKAAEIDKEKERIKMQIITALSVMPIFLAAYLYSKNRLLR